MNKANPVIMDSSIFGPPKSRDYPVCHPHEFDPTVWAQGDTDTSRRCLNVNGDNAKWLYTTSLCVGMSSM
jgi:hypothetical protein